MKVSIFGLGYVGAVTLACLSRSGISVVGVDVSKEKVDTVASGFSPIIEEGLAELLLAGVQSGRITATTSALEAVRRTDVSFISVGTPSRADGSLDLTYVYRVCADIGDAIKAKGSKHIVVLRSTALPGTTAECARILDQHAGLGLAEVAFNPEFLREGQAIKDFDSPAFTIIGTSSSPAENALRMIYCQLTAPVVVVREQEAEMIKYAANAWHATKVVFGNEVGRLAQALSVDGKAVMDMIVRDTKLNISPTYLRPGFSYGGSCLPKDVRALNAIALAHGVPVPLLNALASSNAAHIDHAIQAVLKTHKRRVGLIGLAFKAGTDDLRESPSVELAERLIGKGCRLRILDPAVSQAKLVGANKRAIEEHLPHLDELLCDEAGLLAHAEVVVITHNHKLYAALLDRLSPDVEIINLAECMAEIPRKGRAYAGAA